MLRTPSDETTILPGPPGGTFGPGPGFGSWAFALLLIAAALGMTTLNLALPILPITVTTATGNASIAGTVTAAVALFTVVAELRTAGWMARFGPITVLRVALVVEMVAMAGFAEFQTLPAMLVFGGLVGAGFGTVATVTAATVGSFVPTARQGEAIGYYGLAASFPGIVAPPAAVVLLSTYGAQAVFWLGALACLAAIVIAVRLRLPTGAGLRQPPGRMLDAVTDGRALLIWLAFVLTTITYGAVVSFSLLLLGARGLGSAPVFLLVFGITRAATRVLSGRVIDRRGDSWLTWVSLAAMAVGLLLLPFRVPLLTMAGAILYGAGFGVIQTGTFVAMMGRVDRSRAGHVSGLWNMAVDAGFGLGTLVLAPVAARVGYVAMFWILPALVVVSVGLRLVESRMAAFPEAEPRT